MPRVAHFEIHADNPQRAMAFYKTVFGWNFQHWGGAGMDYWLIMTETGSEPGINGGLMKRHGPPPAEGQAVNSYICTVNVPNLDEYLGKATSNGAAIALPRMPIPGVGWLAYLKDTEGNIFGMVQHDPTAK